MTASRRLSLEHLEARYVPSTDWFSQNIPNPAIAAMVRTDSEQHGSIDFADMVKIYGNIEKSKTVSASQFDSLISLVQNANQLNTPDAVAYLETQLLNDDSSFQYLSPKGAVNTAFIGELQVGSSHTQLADLVDKWFLGEDEPYAAGNYKPVSGKLFEAGGPVFTDVKQGEVGDCWLLSSLAETAVQDPSIIQSMFTYDGSHTVNGKNVGIYTVEFYDNGQPVYVTVDTELPAGGGDYDHPAGGALWVALAEKAYVQANGEMLVQTQDVGLDNYNAINEGMPEWALSAITGFSASDYSIDPTNAAAAFQAGQLVVFATEDPPSPEIVPSHAYAMVGYDPTSNMPFEVYNPWGTNKSGWALGTYNGQQVYGLFNASAQFIGQNFVDNAIAGEAPAGVHPVTSDNTQSAIDTPLFLPPIHQSVYFGAQTLPKGTDATDS